MEKTTEIILLSIILVPLFIWAIREEKSKVLKRKKEKEENESNMLMEMEAKVEINKTIQYIFSKIDFVKSQIDLIKEIKINDEFDFKKIIIDNEKSILEKGGEKQLFIFLKVDSFLKDFKQVILEDQQDLENLVNVDGMKSEIERLYSSYREVYRLKKIRNLVSKMEGEKMEGVDSVYDYFKLFEIGDLAKIEFDNQIKTLEFYENISVAMVVFYLNDKKILYYEIYEAFEKLGVFNSTWQKNVLDELENIKYRLYDTTNQLTFLNQNFKSLIDSSMSIVQELGQINNSLTNSNLLQSISAYQMWRLNKNNKQK
jgi:hypothetical protein